ncbi:ABC transporter ATP-binding protein/permease [Ochrobactrum quorumnocens]|uniref:ABC transporter ATP-binding protein/permease n=1 Tax=Ochrobactrum quorumnocens TaxID=271865 RepID=UPI00142D501A|nr:ABC transporter ATP-binding protein/permease [[Ochrobactrum] quorumnocens]
MLKQFWQLLKYCNSGEGKALGWLLLALIFALELVGIYTGLWLIKWTADFYNALEQRNVSDAINQIGVFWLIVLINTCLGLSGEYLQGTLKIRWREKLTATVISAWMANKAYWHLAIRKDGQKPDNPDQRIAEDCELFVKHTLTEGVGLITTIIALFSYIIVLWGLSTYALSFSVFGIDLTIPRYMLWAAFLYVFISSFMTHFFGRRLKATFVEQQKKEADFRFAMAHVRQHAGDIAVMNGESREKQILADKFSAVRENWFRLVFRQVQLGVFTFPYRHSIFKIPTFLGLPAYFAGTVTFGGLMQLGQAFSHVSTNLSWFIFKYKTLAELVSAVSRLSGFLNAIQTVGGEGQLSVAHPTHSSLHLRDVELKTPDGQNLLKISDIDIQPGKTVWLRGRSGLGKTTLLRLIAGAWNFASGTLHRPDATILVLSQKPYMPNAPLHDAVAYPLFAENFDQTQIAAALAKVGLSKLLPHARSDEHIAPGTLSGGEMQRLSLARAILIKPDWLFLDEATSALDKIAEAELLELLRKELPTSTIVILAHHEPANLVIDSVIDLETFSTTQKRSEMSDLQTA